MKVFEMCVVCFFREVVLNEKVVGVGRYEIWVFRKEMGFRG